jgi:hypothetical protein
VLAGFDAADGFRANAGPGGQFGLRPAGGFASANHLPGDDDPGRFDGRVMTALIRRGQRRKVGILILNQFRAPVELRP